MYSDGGNRCSHRLGFPIRKSPDHSLLAAPRSLSQLTTSFFAYLRQGIHTHALSSLTIKSTSHTTERYFLCAYNTCVLLMPVNIQLSKIENAVRYLLPAFSEPLSPHGKNCSLTADRFIWWAWVELNYRPHPYQGCALAN